MGEQLSQTTSPRKISEPTGPYVHLRVPIAQSEGNPEGNRIHAIPTHAKTDDHNDLQGRG